jgi:hypothetical protein
LLLQEDVIKVHRKLEREVKKVLIEIEILKNKKRQIAKVKKWKI